MQQKRFLGKALLALFICAPFGWADHHTTKDKDKTLPASAQASDSGPMVGMSDHKFMTKAAQGGMAEVQMGQLAQQKGASEAVKEFGRMLEKDHAAANEKLKAIAKERQTELPSEMGAEHQKTIALLNSLSGEEFDRQFIRAQLREHRKDIRDFERAAERSMDTDLREFASGTLPALKSHYQKAQEIHGETRSRRK